MNQDLHNEDNSNEQQTQVVNVATSRDFIQKKIIVCNKNIKVPITSQKEIIQRKIHRFYFIGLSEEWKDIVLDTTKSSKDVLTFSNGMSMLQLSIESELTKNVNSRLQPMFYNTRCHVGLEIENGIIFKKLGIYKGTTNQDIWINLTIINDSGHKTIIKSDRIRYLPKYNGQIPTKRYKPRIYQDNDEEEPDDSTLEEQDEMLGVPSLSVLPLPQSLTTPSVMPPPLLLMPPPLMHPSLMYPPPLVLMYPSLLMSEPPPSV